MDKYITTRLIFILLFVNLCFGFQIGSDTVYFNWKLKYNNPIPHGVLNDTIIVGYRNGFYYRTLGEILSSVSGGGVNSINTGTAAAHTIAGENGLQVLDSGANLYKHVIVPATGYIIPTGANLRVDSSTQCDSAHKSMPTSAASGDLSGAYPGPTVIKINGTSLSALGTGLLKNTNGTGVPSIVTDNSGNWNTAYGWGNWASNFGTTAGTIAQGNDSRINNGQTAYGWGNWASNFGTTSGTIMQGNDARWLPLHSSSDSTGKIPDTVHIRLGLSANNINVSNVQTSNLNGTAIASAYSVVGALAAGGKAVNSTHADSADVAGSIDGHGHVYTDTLNASGTKIRKDGVISTCSDIFIPYNKVLRDSDANYNSIKIYDGTAARMLLSTHYSTSLLGGFTFYSGTDSTTIDGLGNIITNVNADLQNAGAYINSLQLYSPTAGRMLFNTHYSTSLLGGYTFYSGTDSTTIDGLGNLWLNGNASIKNYGYPNQIQIYDGNGAMDFFTHFATTTLGGFHFEPGGGLGLFIRGDGLTVSQAGDSVYGNATIQGTVTSNEDSTAKGIFENNIVVGDYGGIPGMYSKTDYFDIAATGFGAYVLFHGGLAAFQPEITAPSANIAAACTVGTQLRSGSEYVTGTDTVGSLYVGNPSIHVSQVSLFNTSNVTNEPVTIGTAAPDGNVPYYCLKGIDTATGTAKTNGKTTGITLNTAVSTFRRVLVIKMGADTVGYIPIFDRINS